MEGAWQSVTLLDGSELTGVLHNVDPETGNVVLLRPTVRPAPRPTLQPLRALTADCTLAG